MSYPSLDNKWYQRVWLPFAAATYIVICIFDFIIMPVYVTAHNSRIENAVFKTLVGKDAADFADGLIKANQAQRQWNPLTLIGGGFLHVAFGALLTGGVVTRGFAKKSEIENYRYPNYHERSDTMDYQPQPYQPNYRQPQSHYGGRNRQVYRDDMYDSEDEGPMPKAQ